MVKEQTLNDVARALARISQKSENPVGEDTIGALLNRCAQALSDEEADLLTQLSAQALDYAESNHHPEVTEVRPQTLECDVVRFQNNK
jgi:ribonucleoside-diphosphate reductase alpha chain